MESSDKYFLLGRLTETRSAIKPIQHPLPTHQQQWVEINREVPVMRYHRNSAVRKFGYNSPYFRDQIAVFGTYLTHVTHFMTASPERCSLGNPFSL